ncbi:KRAB-A domain-containing protein 2-like [Palaemon carinicauda]|uniref:KRAB-A domain-containing protein 2-like n=1 Tax=Palaemon carinicauda TaxID=392227 RepID=UPI0035B59217
MPLFPQEKHKRIMVYQCHLTTFVILRHLTSKRAAEVAFQLLDIFSLISGSRDEGSLATSRAWQASREAQSEGSVERANSDIEDMLASWVSDNTRDWPLRLRFVQNLKNSLYYSGIKSTPYGLTSTSLLQEVIDRKMTLQH